MRSYILLFLVLAGCRDRGQLQTVSSCGKPCYTLPGRAGFGPCRAGAWVCPNDDETQAVCEGQVGPDPEVCDGIDNNCDGKIDGAFLKQTCSNPCGTGTETCKNGVWAGCTAPQPSPEVCNGFDDNCDGKVDETEGLPMEFCYDGPPGTTAFGECRPGVTRCEYGQKVCYGEIVPRPEFCNGKDDNCDGRSDENLNTNDPTDMVFVIDNSGSMTDSVQAVKMAVAGFATSYATRPEVQWALVVAPDRDGYYDGDVKLAINLTDPMTFNTEMQKQGSTGGGSEPTLDAIHKLASPANPLGINWRPNARRHMVMFTDEEPQSYATPLATPTSTTQDIAASNPNLRVHVFTLVSLFIEWQACGPLGQLDVQVLTGLPSAMQSALETLIQEATCH